MHKDISSKAKQIQADDRPRFLYECDDGEEREIIQTAASQWGEDDDSGYSGEYFDAIDAATGEEIAAEIRYVKKWDGNRKWMQYEDDKEERRKQEEAKLKKSRQPDEDEQDEDDGEEEDAAQETSKAKKNADATRPLDRLDKDAQLRMCNMLGLNPKRNWSPIGLGRKYAMHLGFDIGVDTVKNTTLCIAFAGVLAIASGAWECARTPVPLIPHNVFRRTSEMRRRAAFDLLRWAALWADAVREFLPDVIGEAKGWFELKQTLIRLGAPYLKDARTINEIWSQIMKHKLIEVRKAQGQSKKWGKAANLYRFKKVKGPK